MPIDVDVLQLDEDTTLSLEKNRQTNFEPKSNEVNIVEQRNQKPLSNEEYNTSINCALQANNVRYNNLLYSRPILIAFTNLGCFHH